MKELIKQNYESIVKRGLITLNTTTNDFVDKLFEEVSEVDQLCLFAPEISEHLDIECIDIEKLSYEIADVILTALNFAKHYDIDIERYLKDKIEINFKRAKDA